jgi:hypothetical protein
VALANHMNNNRLSTKKKFSPRHRRLVQRPLADSDDKNDTARARARARARIEIKKSKILTSSALGNLELRTEELNIEKENNYNLLLKKVRDLLNKPSNYEVYPNGKIFIKSEKVF